MATFYLKISVEIEANTREEANGIANWIETPIYMIKADNIISIDSNLEDEDGELVN